MLKVVLFGVGYMANIFEFFRLVSYFVVILVILVLPLDFMFHQHSPEAGQLNAVYKSINATPHFRCGKMK
jgi:hypothetical protein